ncbi:MAG: transcriptional regulator [Nostoc sp.]
MELGKPLKIADPICELRQQIVLSGKKFAAKLGVCLRRVNRWENASVVSSRMALKLIEEMLEKDGRTREKITKRVSLKGTAKGGLLR